jgi:creatinine amidohydrolase/Fe(II)-dependent formamide hydrolase-like protein
MFDKMEISKRWLFVCLLFCCLPAWSGSEPKSVWMEDLTWVELKTRIDAGAKAVILPTGGVEQNGPYIALGKHNWVVAHAAQEIASALGNTLVAPVVRVVPQGDMAKPAGNLLFPGTLALREDTFERVLTDVVLSLAYAGFQNIYLLGDHGLSQAVQARVAMQTDALLKNADVRVWHVSAFYQPEIEAAYLESLGIGKEKQGDHAGVADMAQILYASPSKVRRVQLLEANASARGYSGRPDLATTEMGYALLKLRTDAVLKQIKKFE